MNIQEQIRAFQQKRNEAVDRQTQIMKAAGDEGRTLDDEESSEYDGLSTEVKHIDSHLKRLRQLSEDDGEKQAEEVRSKGPTILVRSEDPEDRFQGQAFVRRAIAKAIAHMSGGEVTAAQVAEHRWGKTHPNLVRWIKADVSAAVSGAPAWAGNLVSPDNRYTGDFIEYLAGMTVYDRLPLREVPANVTIKGQDGIASGHWVGEAHGIPISDQSFTTVSLTPLKVAAISVLSNEIIRDSSPAAEALVRDGLATAIAQEVDGTFLSTDVAVAGVSPAGMLWNLAAETASGSDAESLRADVYTLYESFLTAKNASGLYMVMNPALAKAISLMINALGQVEFPGLGAGGGTLLGDPVVTGDNVDAGHLILLKPSDIWRIGDGGLEVSISRDATLEMSDAPEMEGETPTGPAALNKMVNMFQTESTAFKVVRSINFAKRRDSVTYVGDAAYGVPVGGGV